MHQLAYTGPALLREMPLQVLDLLTLTPLVLDGGCNDGHTPALSTAQPITSRPAPESATNAGVLTPGIKYFADL